MKNSESPRRRPAYNSKVVREAAVESDKVRKKTHDELLRFSAQGSERPNSGFRHKKLPTLDEIENDRDEDDM